MKTLSRREAVRGATFALALAPIPAAAATGLLANPVGHPDVRILALAAEVARTEATWDTYQAAMNRGEASEADEDVDRVLEPIHDAVAELIPEPAHTVEGMLAKARVAMRHLLTGYSDIRARLPATPEEGYADAVEAGFGTDAIVLSLWADLEQLAGRA